jgi:hypothetical protein
LIRRWSHDLENEPPGEQPVIAHFKNSSYELFYLAATHETSLDSPTLKLVDKLFKEHHFEILLVEPFPHSAGQSPAWAVKEAKQGIRGNFILGGEAALAVVRADAKKISFFGGEPDHHLIYQSLRSRGYTDQDIVGFYLVRQIPQWLREKQDQNGLLERNAPHFIKNYCKEFPVTPCPNLRELRAWFKAKMNRELGADIINAEVDPIADGKLLTQRMASAVSDVRDKYTLNIIEDLLREYKQVAVVYGSGHFVTLRKSLDAALGTPSFESK